MMKNAGVIRLFLFVAPVAAVSGCNDEEGKTGSGNDAGSTDADADADADSDTGASSTYPKACADLYDETLLPNFEVEIDSAGWENILTDCASDAKNYYPAVFRYGDESIEAMIRLKGAWSRNCDKMQFVISFNETNKDGRFHGLRKIVLDAPYYDQTLLHERTAFYFMKRLGVPYSCVNNAKLTINGEYYGIYANVERIDREYLERHFSEPDGNLYKEGLELKTNEESADTSRITAFWNASGLASIDALVELEEAVDVWAGLAMTPDPDSYWAGVEINFYLYDHPTRGFLYLPYDMDTAFPADWGDMDKADPILYEHSNWLREPHYEIVLSDTAWCERYVSAMQRALNAYDVSLLQTKLDEWSAQIEAAVEDDPHKTFTFEEHTNAVKTMRSFFLKRAEFIDSWLETPGHCPPVWPARDDE